MRHWRILDMHGKTSATAGGICFSWTTNGGNGAWTNWPPHEHEKDLEEVYCYFDMDDPHFGLHLSYVEPGDTHGVVALFYGLTKREHIEKKHLHGKSYGR